MNDKILGVIFIIVAIVIIIWPYVVPPNVVEIIKWIVIAVLIIAGVFLLIRQNIK